MAQRLQVFCAVFCLLHVSSVWAEKATQYSSQHHRIQPEEAKKRMLELTLLMDTDGDRMVTTDEMQEWILRSLRVVSLERTKQRFNVDDADKNGKVTWAEYLEDFKNNHGDDDNDDYLTLKLKHNKELFDLADADVDGELNLEEYHAFSVPEEHPNLIPVLVRQVMVENDEDRDGFLTFREYLLHSLYHHDEVDTQLNERERFDDNYDKDDDGVLNKNEVALWMDSGHKFRALRETVSLLHLVDEDLDGKFSFEEILENYEYFLTSEVTDYGDHMHNMDRFHDEL